MVHLTVILKRIKLVGSKGTEEVDAVFDSGSTYSCIRTELAQKLETVLRLPEPMEFDTAERGRRLVMTECTRLNFHFDGMRFSDEFMLIPELSEPVIIGAKTLQAWRMKLDFEREQVVVDPRVTKLRLLELKGLKRHIRIRGPRS